MVLGGYFDKIVITAIKVACIRDLLREYCGIARLQRLSVAIAGRSNGMFYTYVVRSKKDSKLYIGWTDDLQNRLSMHNRGLVESTRSRVPIDLIYYEACLSKEKAVEREKQLKSGFGRAYLKRRLE